MAAGDLTTIANVKGWGGKADSSADTVLSRLVSAASAWISELTSRDFGGVKSYSEIRDGSGGTEMLLANVPVASIASLTVDTFAIAAQSADGKPGYFVVRNAVLALYGYSFNRGRKNVRVAYSAGYSAVPLDLEQACVELVWSTYQRGQRGGPEVDTKSLPHAGETYRWKVEEIPASVRRTLAAYSKVVSV